MRKSLFVLIIVVSFTSNFAQSKYLIYFKDKGIVEGTVLNKTSQLYQEALKEISDKAIERRKQVMGDEFITFEDLPLNQSYISKLETMGIKIENRLKWFNAVSAYLYESNLERISSLPFVKKIERIRIIKRKINDTNEVLYNKTGSSLYKTNSRTGLDYGQSFNQNNISEVPVIHDLGISGKDVYVGILDNGFNWKTHKAISTRNVVKEYDYVGKDGDVSNAHNHGTAVFSMLGGYDVGRVIGPAFDAKFFLARTENDASETRAEEDNYAQALQDMEAAGVQITSSSLGYTEFDGGIGNYTYASMNGNTSISTKAVNYAFERGMTLFTAAGNEGDKAWRYISAPGDAYNVITVGAVSSLNVLAAFSSRGPTSDGRIKPEIVAMGVLNYYAVTGGGYGSGNGTSYATPIAAGIGAMLKSAFPHLTNVQIRNIFLESGDNTSNPNNDRGWGLISAKKAVTYPNLQKVNNDFKIHKIFINTAGVNSSTVKINYKIGNGSYQSSSMTYDGQLKYTFNLPQGNSGEQYQIYFTYQNNSGVNVQEPASGFYKFNYGNLYLGLLTDVEEQNIPVNYTLSQNYPNPFNPSTKIKYQIPVTSHVQLKVYDFLGKEVLTLVDAVKQPGNYNVEFNSLVSQNAQLSSGIYFYRLITVPQTNSGETFVQTKKMILIK